MIKGKDLLSLAEFTGSDILKVLDYADLLKRERRIRVWRKPLENRSLVMIFQKPSTRTRISFEVGMCELGGNAVSFGFGEVHLTRGETIEDTARAVSRYADAVLLRMQPHRDIVRFAKASTIPVINGLSDLYHPCQVLADLQTIRENKGIRGVKVAWVGDGDNVCNTMLIGCSKLGVNLSVACPRRYKPVEEALTLAEMESRSSGASIKLEEEPEEAVEDADVVMTDSFVSMGLEEERDERLKVFLPKYRVDGRLMSRAKPDAIFMHCLPAHRGEEVADEVMDGLQSVVWDEAENRLHTQKALLCLLLLDEDQI